MTIENKKLSFLQIYIFTREENYNTDFFQKQKVSEDFLRIVRTFFLNATEFSFTTFSDNWQGGGFNNNTNKKLVFQVAAIKVSLTECNKKAKY